MAANSRDYIGIAEGIRRHELSEKGRIENCKARISELYRRKGTLESRILTLEASLDAAYTYTDEDGELDWDRINYLEWELNLENSKLNDVEFQLDSTEDDLKGAEAELRRVEEEKAQTLFDLQERARQKSGNMSAASGMYGAYSGVGASIQHTMQGGLASLSQAASILGGSIGASGAGGASSGDRGGGSGSGASSSNPSSASASGMSAFTTASGVGGSYSPSSAFSSSQTSTSAPSSTSGFTASRSSSSSAVSSSYKSSQSGGSYASSSFSSGSSAASTVSPQKYASSQMSRDASVGFSGSSSSASSSVNIPPLSKSSFDQVVDSFQGGEYRKVTLAEPTVLYRYFGSVPTAEDVPLETVSSGGGWGSDAGGQFLTRRGNMTSTEAREMLALNPDWGNSVLYRAKVEVPAGTEVLIGTAKKQVSRSGVAVPGGGEQIVINGYWTSEMNSWIKECKVVDIGSNTNNYVGTESKIEFALSQSRAGAARGYPSGFKNDTGGRKWTPTVFENKVTFTDIDGAQKTVPMKRRVYQYNDGIDLDYVRSDGKTNRQAMLSGQAPVIVYSSKGKKVECSLDLHHLTQEESIKRPGSAFTNGSLVEIPAIVHKKYSRVLHTSYKKQRGIRRSFRVVKMANHKYVRSSDDKMFQAFKSAYWKSRASV